MIYIEVYSFIDLIKNHLVAIHFVQLQGHMITYHKIVWLPCDHEKLDLPKSSNETLLVYFVQLLCHMFTYLKIVLLPCDQEKIDLPKSSGKPTLVCFLQILCHIITQFKNVWLPYISFNYSAISELILKSSGSPATKNQWTYLKAPMNQFWYIKKTVRFRF